MKGTKGPLVVAVIGVIAMALLTTVQNALTNDGLIDSQEMVQLGIQGVGAANVYLAANLPGYEKAKFYVMALIAGAQVLYTAVGISSGSGSSVDTTEWVNMGITILTALGVLAIKTPVTTVVNGETRTYASADGAARATGDITSGR